MIAGLKIDEICQMADNYGLTYGKDAFLERASLLQQIIRENGDNLTLRDLNDTFMESL